MNASEPKTWANDFQTFTMGEVEQVPHELDHQLLQRLKPLIDPNPSAVFKKLFGLHLIVGFFSLTVCHQFEMNPFGTPQSLANLFERVGGHHFCMLACGAFFIALPIIAAGLLFSIEEIQALRRTEFLQTFLLGIISLGIFALFGAELAMSLSGLWLLGVLIGGYFAAETVWQIRRTSS